MKVNLSWVSNLPEVGPPIRDLAREIEYDIDRANQEFNAAKQLHKSAMASIEARLETLNREVSKLWSESEVKEAKSFDLDTLRFKRDIAARNGNIEQALKLAIKIDKKRGLY